MNLGVAEMQPTASTPSKRSASPYCLCSGADEHQRYMKRPAWSVSQRMTRGQHSRDKLRCNAQAKGPNTIKPATIMLLPSIPRVLSALSRYPSMWRGRRCHAARFASKCARGFFPSLAASAMLSKRTGERSIGTAGDQSHASCCCGQERYAW
jgi:hypothetical protein